MKAQLQWRMRSTRIIVLADYHANQARLAAASTGTTLSASVVRHLRRASGIFRRRPLLDRQSPNRDNASGGVCCTACLLVVLVGSLLLTML